MNRRLLLTSSVPPRALSAVFLCAAAVLISVPAWPEEDEDAVRRQRYEELLLRSPRKGTALEQVYKLHVESMTLSSWIDELETRAAADPEDGNLALVCGLVFDLQGNQEAAAQYYDRAAERLPDQWRPLFYRGELALFADEYDGAVTALSAALVRTSEKEILLQIYPALGRSYLRSGRLEEAAETWEKMSSLNPGDTQIVEELAELLSEEGDIEGAAAHYEKLLARDDLSAYRRIHFSIKLAGIQVERGEPERALSLYDAALADLGPDNWMFHEVHAQIEQMYHEQNDVAGLIDYYRNRIDAGGHEVELMLRLAEQLLMQDQLREAREILNRALNRAPSRTEIRLRLASVCREMEDYQSAIPHLEVLVRDHPDHLGFRKELGLAWLVWTEGPNHRSEAERLLQSLSDTRPEDPERAVQAATALADAGFNEAATEMYQRATELAPQVSEYYEYLGEHFEATGDRTSALSVFQDMASGERRSAVSLARLADVLSYHGFDEESLAAAQASVELAPEDFDAGMAYLRLLIRRGEYPDALAESDRLEPLVPNVFFGDELIAQRIRLLARADRLEDTYAAHCAAIEAKDEVVQEDLLLAARYAQSMRRRGEARTWVDRILDQSSVDPRIVSFAVRIYQDVGDVEGQISLLRRLAELEPNRRTDHLKKMVSVLQRVGDLEGALAAANSFIEELPASPEGYRMLSRIHARMGEDDQALSKMKRAIHLAPTDMSHRIELAALYEKQFMIPEAIETYWQVVDLSEDISGKLAVVRPLTDLYFAQGRFPSMLERLRRMKRSARDPTFASLAIVSAHEGVDDSEAARRELLDLAGRKPQDVEVLARLVGLTRREGDLKRAVAYHRKVVNLEPSAINYKTLGDLYFDSGDRDAALSAWKRGMSRLQPDSERLVITRTFTWIDQLRRSEFLEEADEALARLYRDHGDDWRVAFRVARAYLEADRWGESIPILQDIALMPPPLTSAEGSPVAGTGSLGKPRPANSAHRFPKEFFTMRNIMLVRQYATAGTGRQGGRPLPFDATDDFEKTQALAISMLAMLEGEDPDLDAWLQDLRHGSKGERHLLLQMAFALGDPEFTAEIADEILAEYPDDLLARHILITPSGSQISAGFTDEFFDTMTTHSAWLSEKEPEFAWYYDWHALRMYIQADRREEAKAAARRLVTRGNQEVFILAQSMRALSQAKFYDVFEECIDGAVSYYDIRGSAKMRDQLLASFGNIAVQILREEPDSYEQSIRLFGKYLDGTDPAVRTRQVSGRAYSTPTARNARRAPPEQFPKATYWWNERRLNMLQRMNQMLVEAGLESEFESFLKARVEAARELDRITPLLALSYYYWWNAQPEMSENLLSEAVSLNPEHDELLLNLAGFYEQAGNVEQALAMARRIQSTYGSAYKVTQRWILRLSLDAGDQELAAETARKLLRTRLHADELLDLSDYFTTLGHVQEAESAQKRASRLRKLGGQPPPSVARSGNQSRLNRIQMHASRGNEEEAVLLARQSLREITRKAHAQDAPLRDMSIEVLRQFGRLDELIEETEATLDAAPEARRLVELLFWCYRGNDRDEEAAAMLQERLGDGREAAAIRLRIAKLYTEEQRFEEAAQQLEQVLRTDPSTFFGAKPNYGLLTQTYLKQKKTDRLAALLRGITPESLLGRKKLFRKKRETLVTSIVNFAKEGSRNAAFDPEVPLALCSLAEQIMPSRHFRDQFGIEIYSIRGQALERKEAHEEAMKSYLCCVVDQDFNQLLDIETPIVVSPNPLHALNWAREGANATILRTVKSAAACGRLEDLEHVALQRAEEGDPAAALLLILCRIHNASEQPVEPWFELAMKYAGKRRGRNNAEMDRINKSVIIGQAYVNCGRSDLAVELFEAALKNSSLKRNSGIETSVLTYFTRACKEADEKDRAREFLLASLEESRTQSALQPNAASLRFQRAIPIMEQLQDMGFYVEALNVAHTLGSEKVPQHQDHFRRRATQFVDKIRKERFPEMVRAGELDKIIASAEQEVDENPDDSARWENLLWLYMAKSDTNRAAILRRGVAERQPDNSIWRQRLARNSLEMGQPSEAADHFAAVLKLDPKIVFRQRDEFKKLMQAFQRSERMDELSILVKNLDYHALIQAPALNRQQRTALVGNLTMFAKHALQSGVEEPALAMALARSVRSTIAGRTAFSNYEIGLADTWLQAIGKMEVDSEERLINYLELLGSPAIARAFGIEIPSRGTRQGWSLGMKWSSEGVRGFLDDLYAELQAAGKLGNFADACNEALEAGEADKNYLLALTQLKLDPSHCSTSTIAKAISSAARYRARVDHRAFLLCRLGQELVLVDRADEAVSAYDRAVDLMTKSGPTSRGIEAIGYLSRAHLARGDREAAMQTFEHPTLLRGPIGAGRRSPEQKAEIHLGLAKKAKSMGFHAIAWRLAGDVQRLFPFDSRNRRYAEAERFIVQLLKDDLEEMVKEGALEEVRNHVQLQLQVQGDTPRLLHQLYRILVAIGSPEVEDVLLRLEKVGSNDPDVLNLLGKIYAEKRDFIKAVEWYATLVRLKPFRELAEDECCKRLLEVYRQTGREQELFATIEEVVNKRIFRIRKGDERRNAIHGVMRLVRHSLEPPVTSFEYALSVAEALDRFAAGPRVSTADRFEVRKSLLRLFEAADMKQRAYETYAAMYSDDSLAAELGIAADPDVGGAALWDLSWNEDDRLAGTLTEFIDIAGEVEQRTNLVLGCARSLAKEERGPVAVLHTVASAAEGSESPQAMEFERLRQLVEKSWPDARRKVRIFSLLGQVNVDTGNLPPAIPWFRSALDLAAEHKFTSDEEQLAFHLFDSLVASGDRTNAASFLASYPFGQARELSAGSVSASQRAAFRRKVVARLRAAHCPLDAFVVARRSFRDPSVESSAHLRSQFSDLKKELVQDDFPAMASADPGALEADLARVTGAGDEAANPGERLEVQYWIKRAQQDAGGAEQIERQLINEMSGDPWFQHELALYASRNEDFDRAAVLYEDLLAGDPAFLFGVSGAYRDLGLSFVRAGRLDELIATVSGTVVPLLVSPGNGTQPPDRQTLNQVVYLAKRLQYPDLNAHEAAYGLAKDLFQMYGSVGYVAPAAFPQAGEVLAEAAEAAAEAAFAALHHLPVNGRTYELYLDSVATPAMQGVNPEVPSGAWLNGIVAGQKWEITGVSGIFTRFLELSLEQSRLPDYLEMCESVPEESRTFEQWLITISRLRLQMECRKDIVLLARTSLSRQLPEDREYLLALLGQELLDRGRVAEGAACFEEAMAGAGESSPRITTLTLLLADTWQSDGDVAKAVEILLRDPWPAEEENRELGDTLRTLVREEHYWKTSEVLLEIGRTREALLLLHKVKGLCKETGKGSYCGKADHLIETLVADGSSAELTVVD
jgi:tetratricopeptide (TPR) repeat protein